MRPALVVAEKDVVGARAEGDTVDERLTIDAALLEQRVLRFGPGRSLDRGHDERDELLFVVSGRGTLDLDGVEHELAPGTGAYVRAGERFAVENEGAEELHVVSVTAPAGGDLGKRRVTVPFDGQPELRADAKRTFRYLVNQDAGCAAVTQFVGIVEPCRAPDHSHTYDEVGYIVEGHGLAHLGGEPIPLHPGSCFHLPPEHVHCIENTGPEVMRILGVFHPSGDPASRSYDEASSQQVDRNDVKEQGQSIRNDQGGTE